jgi:hypothetical protein
LELVEFRNGHGRGGHDQGAGQRSTTRRRAVEELDGDGAVPVEGHAIAKFLRAVAKS